MREITCEEISAAVEKLCIRACTFLTPDLAMQLECAAETEPSPAGRGALEDIVENYTCAALEHLPICQDTGMTVVFASVGQEVHITGGLLRDAVDEGVRRGYRNGYLRKSVVRDPFRRENTGDNTPAVLHTELAAGDRIALTVAPKGFGSENMSAMRLFLPSNTPAQVEDWIAGVISDAGANPCPPVVVGVGLGGTIELAALLAKHALTLPVDKPNPDPFYAEMERRTLGRINRLGIGPQGFGGRTTAVAVKIEAAATHIAGLPCVVNVGCHVTRHASCVL